MKAPTTAAITAHREANYSHMRPRGRITRNGNDGIMGHRGGSIDFVQSIPGTAMVALERGFDLVLLTQNETAKSAGPDAGSIQVLVDSPYQKLSDLAGKKVAVRGDGLESALGTVIEARELGASPDDLHALKHEKPKHRKDEKHPHHA